MPSYDEVVFAAMFDENPAIALTAKNLYMRTHKSDIEKPYPEPRHCSECFEGCPKCEEND